MLRRLADVSDCPKTPAKGETDHRLEAQSQQQLFDEKEIPEIGKARASIRESGPSEIVETAEHGFQVTIPSEKGETEASTETEKAAHDSDKVKEQREGSGSIFEQGTIEKSEVEKANMG